MANKMKEISKATGSAQILSITSPGSMGLPESATKLLTPSYFAKRNKLGGEDGQKTDEDGLSTREGALSLISTNIGGGIVGVPFAFLHLGVPLGIILTALAAFQTQVSCKLYLQTRSMIPGKLESYYELGFMLYGRPSIYYISAVIAIQAFGLMMVYFIVFADISRSIVVQVFELAPSSVFSSRACYCAILGVGLFPQIIKKELKELKIASIILFVGISTFLAVLADELVMGGESANHDKSFEAYWSLGYDVSAVKGASFILVAFGLQCSLFPLFNSLAIQTNANALNAVSLSLYACFGVYVATGLLGLFVFGSVLEESVLTNVGGLGNWQSFLLRTIFLVVLGCHIPFLFFAGKEALLIIIDEFNRQSISKALGGKLSGMSNMAELLVRYDF